MAHNIGWFAVRGQGALQSALVRTCAEASQGDIPRAFRIFPARPEQGWRPWQKPRAQRPWSIAILEGWEFHAAPLWAQAASLHLDALAVSFFVFEGSWSYAVFQAGHEVAAMTAHPLPKPVVQGDLQRAAQLLGVDERLLGRYAEAIQREQATPFPGDERIPGDEWAHVDFARRLGIEYPTDPVDDGELFRPDDALREAAPSTGWGGLPARLELPDEPAPFVARGEIDFDNFPSGDEPF